MAQCRVHYRTYNHEDRTSVPAELMFCDAAGKEVPCKTTDGPEGTPIATFADVGEETVLRVKCNSKEWRLVHDPCYVPCLKECKCEIPLCRAETGGALIPAGERPTELHVELEWCETVEGQHRKYSHVPAANLTIRDAEGDWTDTAHVLHGKGKFHVSPGRWYTIDATGIVLCPGPYSIFVCGEETVCLKICCRPEHLLELVFEDQCGCKLPHTECFIDGHRAKANDHGKIWHVCSARTPVTVQARGDQWTFSSATIDMTGTARKSQTIICHRVPAPVKSTWVILDVEIADPSTVFAYLEPLGEHKGEQPLVLSLDSTGHAQKDFGKTATFLLRLTDKATGEPVYTDMLQTEPPPQIAPPAATATPQIAEAAKAVGMS